MREAHLDAYPARLHALLRALPLDTLPLALAPAPAPAPAPALTLTLTLEPQAFSLTTLFSQLAAGMGPWFIVGDDAYVGKAHIATPFHGTTKSGTTVRALAYRLPAAVLSPARPAWRAAGGQLPVLPGAHAPARRARLRHDRAAVGHPVAAH